MFLYILAVLGVEVREIEVLLVFRKLFLLRVLCVHLLPLPFLLPGLLQLHLDFSRSFGPYSLSFDFLESLLLHVVIGVEAGIEVVLPVAIVVFVLTIPICSAHRM